MDTRNDQRLRESIEEAKRRGLIDHWAEDEEQVIFWAGSVTYKVYRCRAADFLDGLNAAHDRIRTRESKGPSTHDN